MTDPGGERRGIVLSDLHLLSWRSRGHEYIAELEGDFREAEVLVLNGDIFDFEWTHFAAIDEAIGEAYRWFGRLTETYPHLRIHYLFGNHDYVHPFVAGVKEWAAERERFSVHDEVLRIGDCLFLHGDCTNWRTTADALRRTRERTARPARRSDRAARILQFLDDIGLVEVIHYLVFWTPGTVAKRLLFYLRDRDPALLDGVKHIYFGHTHLPFRDYMHGGFCFHNTGSAVGKMEFHPLRFPLPE